MFRKCQEVKFDLNMRLVKKSDETQSERKSGSLGLVVKPGCCSESLTLFLSVDLGVGSGMDNQENVQTPDCS